MTNQTKVLWRATTRSGQNKHFLGGNNPILDEMVNVEAHQTSSFAGTSSAPSSSSDGWNYDTSYQFSITHLPDTGLITLSLYSGASLLHNVTVQVIIVINIIITISLSTSHSRTAGRTDWGAAGWASTATARRWYPGQRSATGQVF